ncbi:MAG: hypothetical protein IKJ80_00460 [Clostridia bacterium]|nr:hypothetical protein [Clostridia bacterium]
MDEYIKKSDLKAELLRRDFYPAIVKNALETIPPAAVVPRAMIAEIFAEIEEGLKYELDLEDKYGRNAWGEGDVSGFQTHEYTEDKLDTFLIALSLLKKKYTEGK